MLQIKEHSKNIHRHKATKVIENVATLARIRSGEWSQKHGKKEVVASEA